MERAEIQARLDEEAMNLSMEALMQLKMSPKGQAIMARAVALNEHGEDCMIGIAQPQLRIEVLTAHGQAFGTVGFALLYDGYVTQVCLACQGKGCDVCAAKGGPVIKNDAIISIVRTSWGYRSTRSVVYGYDAKGLFELKPKLSSECNAAASATPGVDDYEKVFSVPPTMKAV